MKAAIKIGFKLAAIAGAIIGIGSLCIAGGGPEPLACGLFSAPAMMPYWILVNALYPGNDHGVLDATSVTVAGSLLIWFIGGFTVTMLVNAIDADFFLRCAVSFAVGLGLSIGVYLVAAYSYGTALPLLFLPVAPLIALLVPLVHRLFVSKST